MNCPCCGEDYDCLDPPHGRCEACDEDMSDQVWKRDKDEAEDKWRQHNELDEVE